MVAPVLVAVDFSDESEAALIWAAGYATQIKAPLLVLHVVHDPIEGPIADRVDERDLMRPLEEVAGKVFRRFIKKAKSKHPVVKGVRKIKRKLVTGIPAGRICEVAKKSGASQIVIGSHGRTGLNHLILGSVAERVVQLAKVPVTVVKSQSKPSDKKS